MALSGARKYRAEILEGDIRRALKSVCSVVWGMIFPPTVGPRWRLEVCKKRRRGPRAEYNTRRGRGHGTVYEETFADALRRPEIEPMCGRRIFADALTRPKMRP